MRITSAVLIFFVAGATVAAQKATLKLEPVERQMPAYIVERLSSSDRVLFEKLMRVGLESAWSLVTAEGYPQNFINELSPLKANTRMVGRARTDPGDRDAARDPADRKNAGAARDREGRRHCDRGLVAGGARDLGAHGDERLRRCDRFAAAWLRSL